MQVSGSRMSRGVLCAIRICAGGLVWLAATPGPAGPNYTQIIADEAYFVSLSQVESCTGTSVRGAIALNPVSQNPSSFYINPYRANYGARALVAAGSHYFPMDSSRLGLPRARYPEGRDAAVEVPRRRIARGW